MAVTPALAAHFDHIGERDQRVRLPGCAPRPGCRPLYRQLGPRPPGWSAPPMPTAFVPWAIRSRSTWYAWHTTQAKRRDPIPPLALAR